MPEQLVTVAVVPRERFSQTKRSLESVLAHIEPATPVVYVDGGSPPLVRQYLEQQAARHGLRLVSTERYVTPNAARNLAAALVRTRYVAFVDNDVEVSPGWLEALVDCAEATDAWIVGPVCCEQDGESRRIRAAGGDVRIHAPSGRRELRFERRHRGRSLAEVQPRLAREPVGLVPLDAVLVRMDVFESMGMLDEQLRSAAEELDFCLFARHAGGRIFFEPRSAVTYLAPPPFEPYDLPYFQLRWSEAWNAASLARFRDKWDLAHDDPGTLELGGELSDHRRLTLETCRRVLRLLGSKPAQWVERMFIAPVETAVNRRRFPAPHHAAESDLRKAA
jgi:hypothetical protein